LTSFDQNKTDFVTIITTKLDHKSKSISQDRVALTLDECWGGKITKLTTYLFSEA